MANIRELIEKKILTKEDVHSIHDTIIQPSAELVADMKTYGIHIKPGKSIAFETISACESNANHTRKFSKHMDTIDTLRINHLRFNQIGMYKETKGVFSSKRICTLDPEWKKEIIDYVNAGKNDARQQK